MSIQTGQLRYTFDASSLLEGWARYYPYDSFPSYWAKIGSLIAEKRLISPQEVCEEIKKKDDGLHEWCDNHPGIFVDDYTPGIQAFVTSILTQFPKLVDSSKGRSGGDPFVIAVARAYGFVIVTEEKMAPSKIKIPDVCTKLGLPYMSLIQVIRHEGWSF